MHELNEISQAFVEFASKTDGLVVDMGAAYGIATLPILKKRINVIACDMEQEHLDILAKRTEAEFLPFLKTITGCFPHDFVFKKNSIGAILFAHVLHFLTPEELDISLEKLSEWIMPNGKVFIVSYAPYIAPMKNFIPIYEKRASEGIKWPYWVENNRRDYFQGYKNAADNLPPTMNYLDVLSITKALQSLDFIIEKAEYLDPKKNGIPESLRIDGREWSGVIAHKKL